MQQVNFDLQKALALAAFQKGLWFRAGRPPQLTWGGGPQTARFPAELPRRFRSFFLAGEPAGNSRSSFTKNVCMVRRAIDRDQFPKPIGWGYCNLS